MRKSSFQQNAFTLAEGGRRPLLNLCFGKAAFTLAEVLITLAIIGVVAALTIPNIIQSYKKKVVETKLLKFYTTMQEAVKLSEIDNGDKMSWVFQDSTALYNTYLAKYLKVTQSKKNDDSTLSLYLADGSGMIIKNGKPDEHNTVFANFYPNAKDIGKPDLVSGRDVFSFFFGPSLTYVANHCKFPFLNSYGKGFEPYSYWAKLHWDNEKYCIQIVVPTDPQEFRNQLMNTPVYGCAQGGTYCAFLIQYNNWKIPDDYPIKF